MIRLNSELNILYLAHRVVSVAYCRAAGSTVFPVSTDISTSAKLGVAFEEILSTWIKLASW